MAGSRLPSSGSGPKQNTFFGGAAILAAGILIVKLIGMFYKIPLVNIIGEQGNADFSNAYNIYAVLLSVSTAGLPVAVSKLVSEASALDRPNQVRRIFRTSMALFLILGVVSFGLMFFRADWLAGLMNDSKAAPGIRTLAPAVVCVGCLAAFRGYTQGHQNMTPTSVSQIIEALCKLVVGLALAWLFIRAGQPEHVAAAGAIAGVTVGTVVAMCYMILIHALSLRGRAPARDVPQPVGTILREILRIAVPITLSASMVGIITVVDSSLVQGQLQRALLEYPDCWALYSKLVDFGPLSGALESWTAALPQGQAVTMALLEREMAAGSAGAAAVGELLEQVSRMLYGNYYGALNIYNLPVSLMAAITASVIPAVSAVLARKDRRAAAGITGSALRITALLAFPMAVGLCVLGTPIMQLLYPKLSVSLAGPLLSTLGLATVFVCMMLVCNSILQAHGFVNLPVIVMVLGGGVKIATNYNLVVRPQVGIYGAPMGNILCFGLCLVLDLILIARVIPGRPRLGQVFLKPLAASAVMGAGAWGVYGVLSHFLGTTGMGNALSVLVTIVVSMVLYGVMVLLLRAISREDLSLMPKGDRIARLLKL